MTWLEDRMKGIHEVIGSFPISSTKETKHLGHQP